MDLAESSATNPQKIGPWTRLERKNIYSNPWIQVWEDAVKRPDGNPGIYGVVEFKHLATGIVAIDDQGQIPLVGQHRYPLNYYSWEIPEGGGSKTSGTPQDAAARELLEETGIVAQSWDYLGCLTLSNSVSDEIAHLFLARNLTFTEAKPDPTEKLEVKWVPFAEAYHQVLSGEISESISLAALVRAHWFLEQERLGKDKPRFQNIP